jgi:hypothetical protein
MNSKLKISLSVVTIAGLALAAGLFTANDQPYGYIAAPAISSQNFRLGTTVTYAPWFEVGSFKGDLRALPVDASGKVAIIAPLWRAGEQLDAKNPDTGRRIVTTNGAGGPIAFRWSAITAAQKTAIGTEAKLNFVRGDRSGEGTTIPRTRTGVLGDIIHSNPTYVGRPLAGYTFDSYLTYAAANAGRPGRVAVGANDGMLHVFAADNGDEVFAYVPSMVVSNLTKLTVNPYAHTYFVDGPLTAGDAHFGSAWHTVLVGGVGAGGKGYFALDLTSATAANEAAAASKILWEFHAGSAGATNLGYGYGRPSIVRLNNNQWAALLSNGYLSATGKASLYLLNMATGAVIREIEVSDAAGNGLSSPTAIDTNGDFKVDTVYAGDLNGNVWEFDLSATNAADWEVANSGEPLFQTDISGTARQAITTAPEVGVHPKGGYMVYVATGQLFTLSQASDKARQAAYGLWDNDWPSSELPIDTDTLLGQQLFEATHTATNAATRTASANLPDWNTHRGWKTPLEIAGATALDQGERVLQDLTLRDGRVQFTTVNPTIPSGENWYLQLNALTGGAPTKTIIDIDGNLQLSLSDNVDGDKNGSVTDSARDRVIGEFQSFGLASRPVIGATGTFSDAALINHLAAIAPAVASYPDEPGLIGGHIDLDTAHLIYAPNAGTTDGHVHEWDDKWDRTTIDFLRLPDGNGNPLYEISSVTNGVAPTEKFILTVANTAMSRGGVLEINGASVGVEEYHALTRRFLANALLPGETFPVYQLATPNAAAAAAGVKRLTSFKMSFDAFAILSGDLMPTVTGCVRGNKPGTLGEYRNGALMVQALDASNMTGGYTLNAITNQYVTGSNKVDKTHTYATLGLLWESTMFWHWDGPCYGDAAYAAEYNACFVAKTKVCWDAGSAVDDDTKKKADKKKKPKVEPPPPPPPGGGGPGAPMDPDHSVTDTTIAGDNKSGRLFWREWVPRE